MSAYLLALMLPAAVTGALPWHALPDGGADGHLEAALLTRDVRVVCAALGRQRQIMLEVPAGRALLGMAPGLTDAPCAELMAALAPNHSSAPAVVALLSAEEIFGVVSAVQVEPGFLQRLGRAPPTGWKVEVQNDGFVLQREQLRRVGRVGADGWLRISDDERWLRGSARPDGWVSETLQARLQNSDAALVLAGDGALATRWAQQIAQPAVASLAAGTQHLALSWQSDGDKTAVWRLLVDAGFLRRWPKAAPLGSAAREVDAGAQGYAAIELPPDWPELLPVLLRSAAALRDAPDDFAQALGRLRGRLLWVDFGVPGDGALLASSDSAPHAQAMLPTLRDWAKTHDNTPITGAARNFSMEEVPGASGPALHLRPEQGVEGPWLAARDERVFFVQQRARLGQVLTRGAPRRTLLAGPLTSLMRAVLAAEHPLQSYRVLGGNGAWLDYLVWGAGHARQKWEQHAALRPVKRFLPQLFAVASYMWQRTYDVAVTADVTDSVLEVQFAHSEI